MKVQEKQKGFVTQFNGGPQYTEKQLQLIRVILTDKNVDVGILEEIMCLLEKRRKT